MKTDISYTIKEGIINIALPHRIDTNNAADVEDDITEITSANEGKPAFDARDLTYISSAGLRILLRTAKKYGKTDISNVQPAVYDIFETTGFTEILSVSKAMREIDITGCEVIGQGFFGTVYRIDDETIVKVYSSPDSLDMIRNEQRLARAALIAGVSTAISYDTVRIGDSYGSVFELLRAKTFNEIIIEKPDETDAMIRRYAAFMKSTHEIEMPEGLLGSGKEKFMGYLSDIASLLPDGMEEKLRLMLDEVPEQNTLLHGDFQMKNIMLTDGEPMLIDMDTLSAGHPIFDLQSVYVTYFAYGEDDENNSMSFLGIPSETSAMIWDRFIGYYFDTEDEDLISKIRDKVRIAGCIRFLFLQKTFSQGDALYDTRVKHTIEHLEDLLTRTDSLLY
ncbi:MAG: phosphotransferase [Oscillospiraceae bacterium]|nr:phosphotransferase [Oscillospiraceae bacterium]